MAAVALVFSGPIGHPATSRLRNALCGIANEQIMGPNNQPMGRRYDKLYLLLNSGGGSLDDGFALYSLLRTLAGLGIEVTTSTWG
jgi:ATP-dependent protease ClpP protease subunit